MKAKLGVAFLVLVTAAYCWGLLWIGRGFLQAGGVIGWGLGIGVLLLLILTVWAIWREILFGLHSSRLAHEYDAAADTGTAELSGVPEDAAVLPEGATAARDLRARHAREEFEAARGALEADGDEDWQAWYRLALAYDANRDRKHARASLRRAIRLRRTTVGSG